MKLKSEDWQTLVKECERSGLTQNDFCHQKGIPVGRFKYHWRREKELNRKQERIESKRLMAVPRFEEVSISGANTLLSAQALPSVIKIQFPNQIRCEIQMPVSEPELGVLLKQLVALC